MPCKEGRLRGNKEGNGQSLGLQKMNLKWVG